MRAQLGLQTKLLLSIFTVLVAVFMATEWLNYRAMQKNEKKNLQDQAERVRSLLMAYRNTQQRVFIDYQVPLDDITLHFLPAFAIGEISKEYPAWDRSGFTFNNVTDQPRRAQNRADAIELAAMRYFRDNPQQEVLFQPFTHDNGEPYYLYARPIWIEQQCLKCHDRREDAPPTVQQYDTGWGYKLGELRGVLSIKLPAAAIQQRTQAAFLQHLWIQLAGLLAMSLMVLWFVRRHLSRPLGDFMAAMRAVERGEYSRRLTGFSGEFGTLAETFDNMARTLSSQQRALRALNESLEQRVTERTQELAQANREINALNERLQSENLRMSAELDITRRLQQMVLPPQAELEAISQLEIAGFMEPATEIGGDYYDVLQHQGLIKFGIGDVTGHGLESGVLMIMVQTAVRTLLLNNVSDPKVFMEVLNQVLYQNIRRIQSDRHLTLSLLDYREQTVTLYGQHEEVLVVRRDGRVERVDTLDLGFSVGLEPNIAQFVHQRQFHLDSGDGIVLYTDGIIEAFDPSRRPYGIDRLCRVISRHWQDCATEIRRAVIEDVHRHADSRPFMDDLTLLVIKQK
jgi:serine phosphatase RsbU (regulator of sigma subunit)